MMLADHFPHVSYELWATDIAEETLARASRGYFSRHEVDRGLSAAQVQSHFEPDGAGLRAKPYLRRSMRFDIYNLLGKAHPLRTFDLALCRNVLVYFDEASRERAMTRLEASLTPTGWLGLGSTELPVKATPDLVRVPDGGGWLNRASPKGR
jgi:chemotaxis protein methyltransferase CheR